MFQIQKRSTHRIHLNANMKSPQICHDFQIFLIISFRLLFAWSFICSIDPTDGFGDCIMPSNRKGLCLPLKNCPTLMGLAVKKHLSIADRQFLKRSSCGHIGRTPLVCCTQQQQQQPEVAARSSGSPLHLDDLPNDCGQTDEIFHRDYFYVVEYIVGGKESRIGDSPWLALLQYKKGTCFELVSVKISVFSDCHFISVYFDVLINVRIYDS